MNQLEEILYEENELLSDWDPDEGRLFTLVSDQAKKVSESPKPCRSVRTSGAHRQDAVYSSQIRDIRSRPLPLQTYFFTNQDPCIEDQTQRRVERQFEFLTTAAFLLIKRDPGSEHLDSRMNNKHEGKPMKLFEHLLFCADILCTDGRTMTYTEHLD